MKNKYPTAKEVKQIPIEERDYSQPVYPQVTVDNILERLFDEVEARRKSGCCTMSANPLVGWHEHSDPEAVGLEVVEILKNLGYNIWSTRVERYEPEENEDEEPEVISFHVTFDWR